jgi:asparagine synthase (glutamine-hydrolysing)
MCGICGLWQPGKADKDAIRSMNNALIHRGPDDEGYYFDGPVGLGHRRLSIIDLHRGHQPLSNEDGTLWIVFNGEIYNFPALRTELEAKGHCFKTDSDTEAIVHLYEELGPECVKPLRGMFAFAIWDNPRQRLFLARDHVGQKPLFFYQKDGAFGFASEIKALLRTGHVSAELDAAAMNHLISLRFIPETRTLFKEIHKLPAGHWLMLENGKLTIQKYWDLQYTQKLVASESEVVRRLKELLFESVKSHLISDVPIGAFLSGGIDSSTVTAIMALAAPGRLRTFSVGVKEQDFNELPYARLVAEKYGTDHYERVVDADLVRLLPKLIWHMDETLDPFAYGVYHVAQLTRQHVKVVLGGDGGDELFVGYDRYVGNKLVDYYCFLPGSLRKQVLRRLIQLVPDSFSYNSFAQKLRWINEMSFKSGGSRYAESMMFLRFPHEMKIELFTHSLQKQLDGEFDSTPKIIAYFESRNAEELVDRMLYTDMMTRMPEHLLLIVDHMTMAHSLEDRSPLLDRQLVEFAASIPGNIRVKGRQLKYILKQVARDFLPESLLTRRKQGFSFPLAYWIRGSLGGVMERIFQESRLAAEGYFHHSYMLDLLRQHRAGKADHNYRLWILLNLELWWRLYADGLSVERLNEMMDRWLVSNTVSSATN